MRCWTIEGPLDFKWLTPLVFLPSIHSGFGHLDQASHVSLDVLPVKGPPLADKEAFHNPTDEHYGSWIIKPELVVLRPPTLG